MLTAKFVTKVPQGYAQLDRVGQAALVGAEAVGSYEETAAYIRASPPLVARHAEGALKRATDHGIEIDKDNLVYTIDKDSWGNCMVTVFGKQVRTP
jgi:hypothetical protein